MHNYEPGHTAALSNPPVAHKTPLCEALRSSSHLVFQPAPFPTNERTSATAAHISATATATATATAHLPLRPGAVSQLRARALLRLLQQADRVELVCDVGERTGQCRSGHGVVLVLRWMHQAGRQDTVVRRDAAVSDRNSYTSNNTATAAPAPQRSLTGSGCCSRCGLLLRASRHRLPGSIVLPRAVFSGKMNIRILIKGVDMALFTSLLPTRRQLLHGRAARGVVSDLHRPARALT